MIGTATALLVVNPAKAVSSFLFMLICLGIAGHPATSDITALQGRWQAIETTSNGQPPPPGMLEKLNLVFKGDTVSIMGAPPTGFTVDTSFVPAHIDLMNSVHQVGIYELKADTLKVCFGIQGDRPKTFQTEKGTNRTFIALKRAKG